MSRFLVSTVMQQDVEEKVSERTALLMPKRYRVVLLNDDYTPMDFVVLLLKRLFSMSEIAAISVMLEVHYKGRGVCGIFSRDVAETKVAQVNAYAKSHEHPLLCRMEPHEE